MADTFADIEAMMPDAPERGHPVLNREEMLVSEGALDVAVCETVWVGAIGMRQIADKMHACASVRGVKFAGTVHSEPFVGQRQRLMFQFTGDLDVLARDAEHAEGQHIEVTAAKVRSVRDQFVTISGWATDLHDEVRWNHAVDGAVFCDMVLTGKA